MNVKNYQKLQDKYTSWNVKPYLKSGLSKIEILQLKEAFDLFDIDQKGIIDINDLKERLNEMGILSKNEEIDKLIANDNISEVDFNTFISILGAKAQCKNKEEVKKLYCVLAFFAFLMGIVIFQLYVHKLGGTYRVWYDFILFRIFINSILKSSLYYFIRFFVTYMPEIITCIIF